MKNIHVLPTNKPSELYINIQGVLSKSNSLLLRLKSRHIYITSDEEIKEGDWFISNGLIYKVNRNVNLINPNKDKKIILATDPQLIQDGVQAIDDEFLEWFVKNPSCEEVKVEITEISCIIPNFGDVDKYKIIIPKEEPKQETLEEVSERFSNQFLNNGDNSEFEAQAALLGVNFGAKWQQERMYSEDEVIQLLIKFNQEIQEVEDVRIWFEQFKKK